MIVLEGCDCAGKSTIAWELVREIGPRLRRFERYGMLQPWWDYNWMYVRSCESPAVVDRFIVSEFVYGRLWRGGPSWKMDANGLTRVQEAMKSAGAITVYVRPPVEIVKERMTSRGDKFLTVDEVDEVYRLYDEYLDHVKCQLTNTPVIRVSGTNTTRDVGEILSRYQW